MNGADNSPYRRINTSFANRLARFAWGLAWLLLFRPSPRPFHAWRTWLLRCFGARLGPGCHIYAGARIWAPWNLTCGNNVAIADGVEIYNPAGVKLGAHSIISQGAFLCGASHDYQDPAFPMASAPIVVDAYAWIGSRAVVQMGIRVGAGAILALGAIATEDLKPWCIYGGVPARFIKLRPNPYAES